MRLVNNVKINYLFFLKFKFYSMIIFGDVEFLLY